MENTLSWITFNRSHLEQLIWGEITMGIQYCTDMMWIIKLLKMESQTNSHTFEILLKLLSDVLVLGCRESVFGSWIGWIAIFSRFPSIGLFSCSFSSFTAPWWSFCRIRLIFPTILIYFMWFRYISYVYTTLKHTEKDPHVLKWQLVWRYS